MNCEEGREDGLKGVWSEEETTGERLREEVRGRGAK